ncbi:MAG: GatB/YqeY domain-containing protein [Acidimicrobiia bacterium]|nr:GatB/YqeY domain-containing protein [Acidimicrobiia bacterium]
MSIEQDLADELRDALRAGDVPRKNVIRAVQTEAAKAKSAPGFSGEVDDAFYLTVIGSFVKKMDKSRLEYEGLGERGEKMAKQLGFEVEYLSRWLPKTLDEARSLELVKGAIAELGATDPKEAGKIVGFLMKAHKGEIDGALINRLVRSELE